MGKKRILIVDDDVDTQNLLQKRLMSQGFDCVSATSVELAMAIFDKTRPDLIILDLMFPGPNGTGFLHFMKRHMNPHDPIPPVIVISGCDEKEVINYVLTVGAASFVKKPINSKELLSIITKHINQERTSRMP